MASPAHLGNQQVGGVGLKGQLGSSMTERHRVMFRQTGSSTSGTLDAQPGADGPQKLSLLPGLELALPAGCSPPDSLCPAEGQGCP